MSLAELWHRAVALVLDAGFGVQERGERVA
jgi:hypothetical protein